MKPTRPSASRRCSRAASRAWIAVTASVLVTAIPASDAGREPGQPPLPAGRFALDQLVETDAEHSGDELEEAEPLALAARRGIRRQRLRALAGRACPRRSYL